MEQDLLKVLAQFRILLKKQTGFAADFERLMAEPAYAREVIAKAEDSDNEVLAMLALTLHEKLGLMKAPPPAPAAPARPASSVDPQKYKFGARS
jgi:hypothetical protein